MTATAMQKLLILVMAAACVRADTIVSGSSTYQTGVFPFNSDTSFDLVLNGGRITNVAIFHEYQMGAKGGFNADFTTAFNVSPIPASEVNKTGISTPFSVTVNGATYYQGSAPDDATFSGSILFHRLSLCRG